MEQLVNFIIRPPRADYSPNNDLLDEEFMLKGRWYQRKDLEVRNSRGNVLQCSHYVPAVIPEGRTLPCVIYCHGNSGCRADASEAAIILLPSNITVFTLDFSGSGLSEGEHVTLGWNEKDDLKAVVNYLRTDGNVSCIGLWGRSMGAVTSLMYGAEDPSIAGMVLDSPFSNLVDLMMELVDTYKYPLPKFTVKLAIQHMRKVIRKKANFDIMDLDTIQVAKCCFVPVLFGHATDDDFIRPHHSDRIYESYIGDKNIIKFDGDHNSPRPQFYFDSITIFFHNVLNPPSDEQYPYTMHNFFDKDNWDHVHEIAYGQHNLAGPRSQLASVSTEDAITQLRSRRPMSRTDVPSDISSQEKQDGLEVNGVDGSSSSRLSSVVRTNDHFESLLDDEYVEYSFDNLSDIPSSMEDEERMIMEAIIASLKDVEQLLENTVSEEGTTPSDTPSNDMRAATPESSDFLPEDTSSVMLAATPKSSDFSPKATATTTSESFRPEPPAGQAGVITIAESSKTEPPAMPVPTRPCGASDSSGMKCFSNGNTSDGTRSSASSSSPSKQNVDTGDGTRATLVVQKNPSNHVIEGLAHRWGLNFFKSNR